MATTLNKQVIGRPVGRMLQSPWHLADRISEGFWFLLSFTLFIVLGPFSAPIALIALFKLGLEDNSHQEPQSIS